MSKPIVLVDSDGALLCLPSAYSKSHLTPPTDIYIGKVPSLFVAECVQLLRSVATVRIIGRNMVSSIVSPKFLEFAQHILQLTKSEINELCDPDWTLLKSYEAFQQGLNDTKQTYYIVGQLSAYTVTIAEKRGIKDHIVYADGYFRPDGLHLATLEVLERIALHESLESVSAGNPA